MPAHHYPFIDLAVHASVRDHFARGDAVAVLSRDLGDVLWANGAAAQLFGFSNIYDVLDEGLGRQSSMRRQIESAVSGLSRTGRPQNFMVRSASGFSRVMAPATLEDIILPDGAQALLLTSSQAGQLLAPGARAPQIIAGFEGTGTHVAVLDERGQVLAASSTFSDLGLAKADIERMVADVADARDRLVKRMTEAPNGAMPTAIGRLADDPALNLLFAVEQAPAEDSPVAAPDTDAATGDEASSEVRDETAAPDEAAMAGETGTSPAEASETPEVSGPADEPSATGEVPDDAPVESHAHDYAENVEQGLADEQPRPRTLFDTKRIRDELNARLAKAERDSEIPTAFDEARGLEVPEQPEDTDSDTAGIETADAVSESDAGSEPTSTDAGEITDRDDAPASPEAIAAEDDTSAQDEVSAPMDETSAGVEVSEADGENISPDKVATEDDRQETEDEADAELERDEATAVAVPEFRFDPEAKPARFVWKINSDGEFSEVSPEFAAAVGPHAADIIGRKFPDLARVFNLDPDHVISDLLNRRDTWSGKTVFWPIQGTDLVTPVDLAALPTYTRDRRFDGFRGFGIVRIGEARSDPEALGLALVPGRISPTLEEAATDSETSLVIEETTGDAALDVPMPDDETDLEMRDLEADVEDLARMDGVDDDAFDTEGTDAGELTDEAGDAQDGTGDGDPFRGERPAIRLVETPMRRESDKVISLEAHRPRSARESLSPGEQAAFREIGARLSETSTAPADASAETPEARSQSPAPDQPDTPQPFGKRPEPPLVDERSGTEEMRDDTDPAESPDALAETGMQPAKPAGADGDDADTDAAFSTASTARADDTDAASPATADDAPESPADAPTPLPSAFALPARQVMVSGMDAGIIDAIPAALLVHSGDELIHANTEFLELTGYQSLAELADRGGLDHLLERPGENEAVSDGGLFVRRGDGGRREVTARLRSVNWGDGQALMLALAPRDTATPATVTPALDLVADGNGPAEKPEQSEQTSPEADALAIEAQELRSILETATDGVVILNNDGSIRSMNGSACALFNYDEAETRDQPFAMLFAHESQRAVMDYVSGLADHGVSSVLNDGREVIGREASGGFLPLFMTIGRLSGSNGYCAVLRDITSWKRTEEELRNAKRAAETANSHKSDFLARVSHEIRTPLNAIIGFSEMMVEERFGPIGSPRYLEYAHDIGNSGKHVLDIVNDLLDISKIEAGQVSMEFVSVSLNDHLAESVSLLQPMANSQRVIIRTSLSASVPDVVADQRSIKQIALNLLSNAIRYTPSGGQIVVSTSYEPSGNVMIRIRDTGIGMNRKELEQAMKPFGQVGPGPRQRGEGTGLGLPLTKAMVEANRAQFEIVSAPGEGTLVSISFPPQRVLAD